MFKSKLLQYNLKIEVEHLKQKTNIYSLNVKLINRFNTNRGTNA